jgi:Cyclin, N-terminal domain
MLTWSKLANFILFQICVFREVDVFPTAINLSDRFFALFPLTSKDQIQLVGATSLQLASKLRETVPVSTEEVLFFTDDAYAAKDLKVCFLLANFPRLLR